MKKIQKIRKQLSQQCPEIYRSFFEHLSDEKLVAELDKHRATLLRNQGESVHFTIQSPDGEVRPLRSIRVPGDPAKN